MGKTGSVAAAKEAAKKEYISNGNGRRKVWDVAPEPERCPDGYNMDIWHLALFFRDKVEATGEHVRQVLPVIYKCLQRALTNLSGPDILARALTTGIDTTKGNDTWISIVEIAIEEYINHEPEVDIDIFSSSFVFKYYIQRSIDTLERELLLRTGKQVVQPSREIKPSRRTEEEKLASKIRAKQYTEDELKQKLEEFKARNTVEHRE